jgi:hypothetical protein
MIKSHVSVSFATAYFERLTAGNAGQLVTGSKITFFAFFKFDLKPI